MIKIIAIISIVLIATINTGCSDRTNRPPAELRNWVIDKYMYIENDAGTKAILINSELLAGIGGGRDSDIEIDNSRKYILRGKFTIAFKDGTMIEWIDGEMNQTNDGNDKILILK